MLDPRNSQILTSIDVMHHPDVIRALFMAVTALENKQSMPHLTAHNAISEPRTTRVRSLDERRAENVAQGLPANRSLPWEDDATSYLLNAYDHGKDISEIAEYLGADRICVHQQITPCGKNIPR